MGLEPRPPKVEGWRSFLLPLLLITSVLVASSVAAFVSAPTPRATPLEKGATIYYNEACSDCAVYLSEELLPALASAGVEPRSVRDYINEPRYREELRALNDALGIPFELQSHLATFVLRARLTVFEGHVPPSLILEALATAGMDRLLIHQDSMGSVSSYGAWAFTGTPRHFPLGTPLTDYVTWLETEGRLTSRTAPALLPLVIGAGLVDGLNPCAFAVILFLVSLLYVARRPRGEIGRMGGLYVYAVFLAYLLIGLGLIRAISLSADPHILARIGGILVVLLGAFTMVHYVIPTLPNPFHTPRAVWDHIRRWMLRGTMPGAAVAGFLVGLCTFPCSGGIYVAVLGLLAAQTTYWEGLGYLYLYNIAFVLPLVLVLLVVSNKAMARRATAWERNHTKEVRLLAGIAMVLVGILTVVLA